MRFSFLHDEALSAPPAPSSLVPKQALCVPALRVFSVPRIPAVPPLPAFAHAESSSSL